MDPVAFDGTFHWLKFDIVGVYMQLIVSSVLFDKMWEN